MHSSNFKYETDKSSLHDIINAQSVSTNALLQIYNPAEDSDRLKNQPELFETLRGDYPLRREEQAYIIKYKE